MRNAATRRKPPADLPEARRSGTRRKITEADLAPLVLLVDDAEDNRALYAEYLQFLGLRVLHAVDGEHALLKIMQLVPDLVVMDLAMPILDGWEAIRQMKANPTTRDIPVIALTGQVSEENLLRAHAAGAYAVLTKPCAPAILHALIRDVLDRTPHDSS
jgi:two-component system, cell cycle response regulator DivK